MRWTTGQGTKGNWLAKDPHNGRISQVSSQTNLFFGEETQLIRSNTPVPREASIKGIAQVHAPREKGTH